MRVRTRRLVYFRGGGIEEKRLQTYLLISLPPRYSVCDIMFIRNASTEVNLLVW